MHVDLPVPPGMDHRRQFMHPFAVIGVVVGIPEQHHARGSQHVHAAGAGGAQVGAPGPVACAGGRRQGLAVAVGARQAAEVRTAAGIAAGDEEAHAGGAAGASHSGTGCDEGGGREGQGEDEGGAAHGRLRSRWEPESPPLRSRQGTGAGVRVVSIRRGNGRVVDPATDPALEDGDTLVLSGRLEQYPLLRIIGTAKKKASVISFVSHTALDPSSQSTICSQATFIGP